MDPSKNPKCSECGSIDIEPSYRAVFKILVCKKCKEDIPEKYSLLTKTGCKEVCARYTALERLTSYSIGLSVD